MTRKIEQDAPTLEGDESDDEEVDVGVPVLMTTKMSDADTTLGYRNFGTRTEVVNLSNLGDHKNGQIDAQNFERKDLQILKGNESGMLNVADGELDASADLIEHLSVTMDSGATEHVIPVDVFEERRAG